MTVNELVWEMAGDKVAEDETYLVGRPRGYGDSILFSFTWKRFSLTVKHEGEAVRHEKTLAGGLDPPVVHLYQMRFLQLF